MNYAELSVKSQTNCIKDKSIHCRQYLQALIKENQEAIESMLREFVENKAAFV